MKTRMLLGIAVLLAAVFAVLLFFDKVPAVARTPAATNAPVAHIGSADSSPPNEREAAPVPAPRAARSPADVAAPVPAAPARWLARFLVVDEDDAPVPDAIVTVQTPEQLGANSVGVDRRSSAEARTDRSGLASVRLDSARVLASAHDGPRRSGAVTLDARPDVTKLVLETLVTLRGVVRRANGSPGAGAAVTARGSSYAGMRREFVPPPQAAVSDADGRFELHALAFAVYEVSAELDGERSIPVHATTVTRAPPELLLTFAGAIGLHGLVVAPNGTPVANAKVHIRDDPDGIDLQRAAATDAAGRFTIDLGAHASYWLVASASGHADSDPQRIAVTPEHPHAETRLVLQSLATIGGVVCHGDGTSLAGVPVFASDDGYGIGRPSSFAEVFTKDASGYATTSDIDGRFVLRVDPRRTWKVVARPVASAEWLRVVADDIAAGRDDVVLTVRTEDCTGCVVRGDVVTADARPVTEFRIVLVECDARGRQGTRSGTTVKRDGHRFELPPLPLDRTFAFDVHPLPASPSDAEQLDATLAPVRLGPFRTTASGLELHAFVAPWGQLPVQVLTADGKRARNVFATTLEPQDTERRWFDGLSRVDATGRTTLRSAPGPRRLVVTDGTTVLHERAALVASGLNPEIVVRLLR